MAEAAPFGGCRAWRYCSRICSPRSGAGQPAHAQSYPNRPIKLIVAVLPGGPMDVMGRLIAQHLSSTFGQVFVENRAGAGTTLGAKAVASAEPDGYTLLLGNAATLAIGPTLVQERRLRSAARASRRWRSSRACRTC
jgi:tripartite-type tricarboxylate transporter receptor subunit TctC